MLEATGAESVIANVRRNRMVRVEMIRGRLRLGYGYGKEAMRRLFPLRMLPRRFMQFYRRMPLRVLFRLLLTGFLLGAVPGAFITWYVGNGSVFGYGLGGMFGGVVGAFIGSVMLPRNPKAS